MIKKPAVVLGRVEKIVGKEENAGYQHFLLFPKCFQKASLSRSLKCGLWCKELTNYHVICKINGSILEESF